MADKNDNPQESQATRQGSYRAPSRVGQVSVTAYVSKEAKQALKMLAIEKDVPMQHLLCIAINNLLEENGGKRIVDESILPRGGAAHRRG